MQQSFGLTSRIDASKSKELRPHSSRLTLLLTFTFASIPCLFQVQNVVSVDLGNFLPFSLHFNFFVPQLPIISFRGQVLVRDEGVWLELELPPITHQTAKSCVC